MGIRDYEEIQNTDTISVNKQFLSRLKLSLETWKDTSIPKNKRLEELNRAREICDIFILHMRTDLPFNEGTIILSIFANIQNMIIQAMNGKPTKFNDAIVAIDFINNSIKL